MKKLLVLLMICSNAFAQTGETEFSLTKEKGLTNYVVLPFEGKTQAELYKKALQWFEVYYKNPKEVVKGTIENDYVRFTGSKYGIVCLNALGKNCYDSRYTVEISFKDGKVKFDLTNLEYYTSPSQYGAGGWASMNFDVMDAYFNKKGEWKGTFKYYPEIPGHINDLMNDFKKFMAGENIPSKEGW